MYLQNNYLLGILFLHKTKCFNSTAATKQSIYFVYELLFIFVNLLNVSVFSKIQAELNKGNCTLLYLYKLYFKKCYPEGWGTLLGDF